jgi:hypothetical protein
LSVVVDGGFYRGDTGLPHAVRDCSLILASGGDLAGIDRARFMHQL